MGEHNGRTSRGAGWAWIAVLVLCLVLAGAVLEVRAQDYSFSLDQNISRAVVQRDGSADIEYLLTFTNSPGAHAIDIVDIGLPNSTYNLGSARAWFSPGDGSGTRVPLDDIRKSEYVDIGVEVHLDEYAIPAGQQGSVHFTINVREMVFPDTEDETYASLEFAPTFFDSSLLVGTTYKEIHLAFPPGVTNEETRYHGQPFDEVDVVNDRIVFIYVYADEPGHTTHKHGISFPRTSVDQVYKPPVVIGGGGGGGGSALSGVDFAPCCGLSFFGIIFAGAVGLGSFQNRKRKMKYLPPSLAVEGVGIKRGLTAVEAAILLEKPLNKVLTMVMFGLLKKQAIVVASDDPLRVEKVDPMPDRPFREYETAFLEAIKKDGSLDEKVLQKGVVALIKDVNKKMKGFSRKETVAYYESIVDRAWEQVSGEETPEIKSKYFDQGLEWMMMDEKFDERTERTFGSGPVYMPPWWAYYRPWIPTVSSSRSGSGTRTVSSGGRGSGGGRQVTLPTLPGAAFAATVVGGMERSAGGIVDRIDAFTGGVTRTTNPPPVRTSSSSSHRSGGCACACACACAGCACACAGGGR